MYLIKFLRLFLVLMVGVFFLVGSGGGGGSSADSSSHNNMVDSPNLTKKVFMGEVPAYVEKDSNVTIFNIKGESLLVGKVKDDGSFSMEIENFKKQDVVVEVADKYQYMLLKDDVSNNINVTLLTSLVYRLMDKKATDLKQEEEAVLTKIETIGLLKRSNWKELTPDTINGEYAEALSTAQELSTSLDEIVLDLNDNELKAENMNLFPMVHGGVLSIRAGDNNGITKMLDETKGVVPVELEVNQKREKYALEVVDGEGITVDGNASLWFLNVDTQLFDENSTTMPYKLRVYNTETNKGRFFEGRINTIRGNILIEGIISSKGGRVMTDDGLYGIEIPAGELTESVEVKIISAKSSDGEEIVSFKFDKKLPKGIKIKWISPLEDEKSSTVVDEKPHGAIFEAGKKSTEVDFGYGYYSAHVTDRITNGFGTINARLYADVDGYVNAECFPNSDDNGYCSIDFIKREQWKLMARTDLEEASWRGKQPVLFVHGYSIGDNSFGGGDGTWGRFFELIEQTNDIEDIDANVVQFVPFEFQWKTNTKFELAGDDLAKAIQTIYKKTGKKVLIVAHSFGGVLTRTMIQNPQTSSINNLVSGVVSLGSPYSGISPYRGKIARYNINLPMGYDIDLAGIAGNARCKQISCYQMGDNMTFYNKNEFGRIISLIQKETSWSTSIPLTVGIGLKFRWTLTTGDGLISHKGQRFNLDDALSSNGNLFHSNLIEEKIIGEKEVLTTMPINSELIDSDNGYVHNLPSGLHKKKYKYEAKIREDDCSIVQASLCQHGSYKLVHNAFSKYLANSSVDLLLLVKPTGLKSDVMASEVRIRWGVVGGADKYKIYFSYTPNFEPDDAFAIEESTVNYKKYRFKEGNVKPLYYRVVAVNATGESKSSDIAVIAPPSITLSGYIRDKKDNKPITNATVTLEFAQNISRVVETDERGFYTVAVPTYAKYMLLQIDAKGYLADTLQLKRDRYHSYGFLQKDIVLRKLEETIIVPTEKNSLYHLGDKNFSGDVNSQLQMGTTLGITKSLTFNVTQKQLDNYSYARLRFTVRGAQERNRIYINGEDIGYIGSSPSNGSFSKYYWNIDKNLLKLGDNSFRIDSAYVRWMDDYDDFEFTNVYFTLYDHEPNKNEKMRAPEVSEEYESQSSSI